MLANLYEHRCPKCKRVAMVVAKIKPVTVTFTERQANDVLRALFFVASRGKDQAAIYRKAFARLFSAVKEQTKPRRKV